ncbi:hypothetical protein [Pseudomonas putida]|uniref:hypothetical protein n=1 Tax=Pseudomonas TaxID=286 RepID=UPI0010753E1E|nr:hypothetical protein [Pseudomonas putida]MCG3646513.1 hypothetical protein [Pseudomonas putida]MDD2076810.1 hypothetical protein [Pseudomonas putida]TFW19257.1 hypothetical protein E4L40_24175 [Pseudomonas putida]HDS1693021.1 hypothetical protein [Pseudomonas putida]
MEMNNRTATRQDLQIVEAFSSVSVPEQIIRQSNIRELVQGMTDAQASVQSTTSKLERARREQKEGNFLGNWWNDRDDAVQDAQLDLNKSIGSLTQKSSQLLIVNTAISKILHDQQGVLLQQQNILKGQTDTLQTQNSKILSQQRLLEQQQREINAANEGLMQAKGISQEQAKKLVGCVVRVSDAEKAIHQANQDLSQSVDLRLRESAQDYLACLRQGLEERDERWSIAERQVHQALDAQNRQMQHDQAALHEQLVVLEESLELKLQANEQAFKSSATAQRQIIQQMEERFTLEVDSVQRAFVESAQRSELALEKTHEAFESQNAQLKHQQTAIREQLGALEGNLDQQVQAGVQAREAFEAQNEQLRNQQTALREQLGIVEETLEQQLQASVQARQAFEVKNAQLQDEQTAMRDQLGTLEENLELQVQASVQLQDEQAAMRKQLGVLEENFEQQLEASVQAREGFEAHYAQLQSEQTALREQIDVLVESLEKKLQASVQMLDSGMTAQQESIHQMEERFSLQVESVQRAVVASAKQSMLAILNTRKMMTGTFEATRQAVKQALQTQGTDFKLSLEHVVTDLEAARQELMTQQSQLTDLQQALKESQKRQMIGLISVGLLALGALVWQAILYWAQT